MRCSIGISRYLAIVFGALLLLSAAAVGALEYVGIASDSIALPRRMAQQQSVDRLTLVLPGDLRYWAAFKLAHIAEASPEVVLVGSSRAGQVRSAMFKPYEFYNASFTAWSVGQLTEMVDQITRVSRPRIIIVALDYFMFTDVYATSVKDQRSMHFNNDLRYQYESVFSFIKALTDRPSTFQDFIYPRLLGHDTATLDGLKLIGIDAINNKAGFRFDGSFLYATGLLASAPQRTKENKGLIEAAPGGPRIDLQQMRELEKLATLASERGVQLIGVQFPILKASVDFLNNDQSYHYYSGVWREFESPAMTDRLGELGIPFFNLCCGPIINDSRTFIDAAHLGERGMLSTLINLFEDPKFRLFFPAADTEKLKQDLAEAQKNGEFFNIYHNQF